MGGLIARAKRANAKKGGAARGGPLRRGGLAARGWQRRDADAQRAIAPRESGVSRMGRADSDGGRDFSVRQAYCPSYLLTGSNAHRTPSTNTSTPGVLPSESELVKTLSSEEPGNALSML